MRIRVNLGDGSSVIDTDDIKEAELKDALEFAAKKPGKLGHHGNFGKYKVIHGEILQDGYEMNETINAIAKKEKLVEVNVVTDI